MGIILLTNAVLNSNIFNPFFVNTLFSYLETDKVKGGEVSTLQYKWGPRANLEVDKKELLKMMCEVGNKNIEKFYILKIL